MAIPLIPVVLGASSAAAAIYGLFKGGKAISDNNEADDVNSRARSLQENLTSYLKQARDKSNRALRRLGDKKLHVYEAPVRMFVTLFDMIKNIQLAESEGMDELGKFKIDKQNFGQLKEISALAESFAKGTLSGTIAGGAVAFGAYGAAGALATASTGTAIAGLSGAAATNATLAFFGGGSLAAGGLGVAGGMAVLGGVVAGPAMAIMGAVMGAKASENLDNAYSNLAKVKEAEAEVNAMVSACNGISRRADAFMRVLTRLELLSLPQIDTLANIIKTEGTDYSKYSVDAKKGIAALLSTIQAIKAILDTPLLTEKGALTPESEVVLIAVRKAIGDGKTEDDSKAYAARYPQSSGSFPQEEVD